MLPSSSSSSGRYVWSFRPYWVNLNLYEFLLPVTLSHFHFNWLRNPCHCQVSDCVSVNVCVYACVCSCQFFEHRDWCVSVQAVSLALNKRPYPWGEYKSRQLLIEQTFWGMDDWWFTERVDGYRRKKWRKEAGAYLCEYAHKHTPTYSQ